MYDVCYRIEAKVVGTKFPEMLKQFRSIAELQIKP